METYFLQEYPCIWLINLYDIKEEIFAWTQPKRLDKRRWGSWIFSKITKGTEKAVACYLLQTGFFQRDVSTSSFVGQIHP